MGLLNQQVLVVSTNLLQDLTYENKGILTLFHLLQTTATWQNGASLVPFLDDRHAWGMVVHAAPELYG